MAKRSRRPRVPEVLRRAYGCRVNTLEVAILSLLPTPPPESPLDCSCNGRLCLGCLGLSHLVSDKVPSEYIRFLTNSFCFVSPSAPPPPVNFSASELGLRHKNGFFADRAINCSHVLDHLLERVGDELMAFLLCYSSIFVPLAKHNYLQVTGDPLKGLHVKRNFKRNNEALFKMVPIFSSLKFQKVGDFHPSRLLEVPAVKAVPSLRIEDNRELNSPCNDFSENSLSSLQSRKRRRDFSWRRRRKHKKASSPCLDCIVWHSPSILELGTYIERKFMFYARLSSHSLFPRQHILNRLKPTKSGAISLLNQIFGVSINDIEPQVLCSSLNSTKSKMSCSCFKASKSKCLLHSLIGLFRALIRNSQRCQYKKLFWRHCLNPIFTNNKATCDGSELEGSGVDVSYHMLHRVLVEHLKHNILQIGRDYYLQEVGISQGSVLSSLLCSFYYGHLERNVILPFLEKAYEISSRTETVELGIRVEEDCGSQLQENEWSHNSSAKAFLSLMPMASNLNGSNITCVDEGNWHRNDYVAGSYSSEFKAAKPQNLLLRFIDDFLFISTSKQQAASFFSRMRRGFRAFNCYMNFEKFGLNFDIEEPSLSKRFYTGADGIQFIPWSGLLINCENLEIQADYTRYWGIHVSSTITIQAWAKPGSTLKKKLCDYIRPKCYPLLYDSNINSLATVALNTYQAFLLSAMKFHCSLRSMLSISKLFPSYILGKILFSFRYMYKLLKKRMHYVENRFSLKAIFKLKKMEIIWLGLSAFVRVLKKKQSRYKELIYLLRAKIEELRLEGGALPHLRYAVDDSHSSLFWKIRF